MGPLERLPENALSEELKARLRDGAELKGAFQARGSRSVRTHRIFSQAAYDLQFTASSTEGVFIAHQADIEFIPDDMTFGGAFCWRIQLRVLDTSNNVITWINPQIERRYSSDGKQRWSIYHQSFGYPTDTVRFKLFLFTNGAGTFTVNVIS